MCSIIIVHVFNFTDFIKLCKMAQQRKKKAFRPGTVKNHTTMIRKYVSFCVTYRVPHINPSIETVCAYIEFIASQFKSSKSVQNYVSAVRLLHKYVGEPGHALDSFDIVLMLRACKLTMRHIPHQRPPVTVHILLQLCRVCEEYPNAGIVVKMALILGFFALLRCSNICPGSEYEFDPTRDLQRRDIRVTSAGLTLRLKWSKTLQVAGQPRVIPLPPALNKDIDPLHIFTRMVNRFPASSKAPLLSFADGRYLTQNQFRCIFKGLVKKAGYEDMGLTPHSLRRGGSTTCFTHGALEIDIQRQGTWLSGSYKNYIKPPNPHDSTVCKAMTAATAEVAT